MSVFEIFALLVSAAAVFSYVNHRFLGLPNTIGLMVLSLIFSLMLIASGSWSPQLVELARETLHTIDFNETLMKGMLGFLLFAGALHVNLEDLKRQSGVILLLATFGVMLSTALVALLSYGVLTLWLGLGVPFGYCLLFGSLISPTDPIAVLGILKSIGAPKGLETKITGESLFNDGVGVVVFLAIAGALGFGGGHGEGTSAAEVAKLFLVEAGGGTLVGLLLGLLCFYTLRSVDSYQVEILISLATVAGGYALCSRLHVSGPLAMVIAGLLIGNQGRSFAMSDTTREHLDTFWELIDEIANAVLFVLIGFELLVLSFTGRLVLAGLVMIPLVLLARLIAVGLPLTVLRRARTFTPHAIKILTWGGLRGGISVALALSIPRQLGGEVVESREVLLVVTYVIVVFSIVVQGLTIGPVVARALAEQDDP